MALSANYRRRCDAGMGEETGSQAAVTARASCRGIEEKRLDLIENKRLETALDKTRPADLRQQTGSREWPSPDCRLCLRKLS
jgi:hypothetical protein